jgi:dihydrofolate reductase
LNGLPKYVVSSTLEDPDWNNSTVLKGDVVNEVSKLKQEISGDIFVLGAGERLFRETSDRKPMHLVDTRTVGDGLAFLTYQPVRDA